MGYSNWQAMQFIFRLSEAAWWATHLTGGALVVFGLVAGWWEYRNK